MCAKVVRYLGELIDAGKRGGADLRSFEGGILSAAAIHAYTPQNSDHQRFPEYAAINIIQLILLFVNVKASERGSNIEAQLYTVDSTDDESGRPESLGEGTHTVTYNATDMAGNTGFCSFDITITGKLFTL